MQQPPDIVPITHDDYHAQYVGELDDGRQFFITQAFVGAIGSNPGREFLATYLFHADGSLQDAVIDDLGTRDTMDKGAARALLAQRLSDLGELTYGDIAIRPFKVERFGVEFGLILWEPEEDDEDWTAHVEPGDCMAFFPPWDGEYDT